MKKIIFLSYDGILEPLGFSQILTYLIPLSEKNEIFIVSVEKINDLNNKGHYLKIKELLDMNNINWKFFIYKKNYLKYLIICKIFLYLFFFLKLKKIYIVHARSYIPALIIFFIKFFIKIKLIFDMRGFWIDERVDWKIWSKKSFIYNFFRYFEKKIIINSDSVITLTNQASILIKDKYNLKNSKIIFKTIPTCLKLKKNNKINKIYNKNKIVLTHLGSIGTRYNFDKYLKLGSYFKTKQKVFFTIINKGEHKFIESKIKNYNLNSSEYKLNYVPPYDIEKNLEDTNLGLFFPIKGYYLNGYFPTKLGEFLSNGIPIITCSINQDVDEIINENNVGFIIKNFENTEFEKIYKKIIEIINSKRIDEKCMNVANKYFDVNNAVDIYNKIYRDL